MALEDEGEGPADPEMVAGVPPELPEMIPIDVAGDELLLLVLAELLSEPLWVLLLLWEEVEAVEEWVEEEWVEPEPDVVLELEARRSGWPEAAEDDVKPRAHTDAIRKKRKELEKSLWVCDSSKPYLCPPW